MLSSSPPLAQKQRSHPPHLSSRSQYPVQQQRSLHPHLLLRSHYQAQSCQQRRPLALQLRNPPLHLWLRRQQRPPPHRQMQSSSPHPARQLRNHPHHPSLRYLWSPLLPLQQQSHPLALQQRNHPHHLTCRPKLLPHQQMQSSSPRQAQQQRTHPPHPLLRSQCPAQSHKQSHPHPPQQQSHHQALNLTGRHPLSHQCPAHPQWQPALNFLSAPALHFWPAPAPALHCWSALALAQAPACKVRDKTATLWHKSCCGLESLAAFLQCPHAL
jgi:hypothetical protein